jgi:hypothetical protein
LNTSRYKSKRGGARPNSGPKPYRPTDADRATVTVMAACGKDQHQIGGCIGEKGLSDASIRRHFARELRIAKDKLDGICMTGIAKAMQEGQAWALCFYAKTRLGWRETSDHRFVDIDGKDRNFNLADIDRIVAEADGRAQGGVLPAARLVQ